MHICLYFILLFSRRSSFIFDYFNVVRKLECSVKTTSLKFHWVVMHNYLSNRQPDRLIRHLLLVISLILTNYFTWLNLMNPISNLRRQVTNCKKSTCRLDCWILHDSIFSDTSQIFPLCWAFLYQIGSLQVLQMSCSAYWKATWFTVPYLVKKWKKHS